MWQILSLTDLVELGKYGAGHIYLATHVEIRDRLGELQGNVLDSTEVFGNVLTCDAITTGCATDENAVFVYEGHRKAVNFRLYGVLYPITEDAADTVGEIMKLVV